MNIAKKFFAGALVAFVALAMTASAFAYTHMGTLKAGSMGTQVMSLQSGLSGLGFIAGTPDGKFGPMTSAAVRAFQASKGVTADGVVGPTTGALLQAATATTGNTNTNNNDNDGLNLETFQFGGDEATLETFDVNTLNGDVQEGEKKVVIGSWDLEFSDSDTLMTRLDVIFVPGDANDTVEPSEIFNSLSLEVDGDEIASIDNADDSDEYKDSSYDGGDVDVANYTGTATDDLYSVRFSGLKEIIKQDHKAKIEIVADMATNLDLADEWTLVIPEFGGSSTDTSALVINWGGEGENDTFGFEGEGENNKITVREGDDNPDASLLEVKDTAKSSEHTVLIAEVEIDEDSTEDIEFKDFSVVVNTGGDTYDHIVDTFTLKVGSYEVEGTTDDGSTGTTTVDFDMDANDLVMGAGDTEDFEFTMKFNALSSYTAGDTVSVDFDSADINAKGDDSNEDVTDLTGSIEGETHELRTDGMMVTLTTPTAGSKVTSRDTNAGIDHDEGEFKVSFNVKGIGQDVYIDKSSVFTNDALPTTAGQGTILGVTYGTYATATDEPLSSSIILESTSVDNGDTATAFLVKEGETRKFTAKVNILNGDPDGTFTNGGTIVADNYDVFLRSINWDDESADTTPDFFYTLNLNDYKTGNTLLRYED